MLTCALEGQDPVEIAKDSGGDYQFNMPDGPVALNAVFTKIPIPVTGVTLNQKSLEMTVGDTVSLTANVQPEDADDPSVTWSSSNKAAATVDQAPTVKDVDKAIAKITGNGDPKGSTFGLPQTKAKKISKKSITLSWTKIKGAKGYIIYGYKSGPCRTCAGLRKLILF